MKDINDKTIKVGDYILYAAPSYGSSASLECAKVLKQLPDGQFQVGRAYVSSRTGKAAKKVVKIHGYGRILVATKSLIPKKDLKNLEAAYGET